MMLHALPKMTMLILVRGPQVGWNSFRPISVPSRLGATSRSTAHHPPHSLRNNRDSIIASSRRLKHPHRPLDREVIPRMLRICTAHLRRSVRPSRVSSAPQPDSAVCIDATMDQHRVRTRKTSLIPAIPPSSHAASTSPSRQMSRRIEQQRSIAIQILLEVFVRAIAFASPYTMRYCKLPTVLIHKSFE
jgi:hypothetical protein